MTRYKRFLAWLTRKHGPDHGSVEPQKPPASPVSEETLYMIDLILDPDGDAASQDIPRYVKVAAVRYALSRGVRVKPGPFGGDLVQTTVDKRIIDDAKRTD